MTARTVTAEERLVAAVVWTEGAVEHLVRLALVEPADFRSERCRAVVEVAVELLRDGRPHYGADLVRVVTARHRNGSAEWMGELSSAAPPTPSHLGALCEEVQRLSVRASMLERLGRVVTDLREDVAAEKVDDLVAEVLDAAGAANRRESRRASTMAESTESALAEIEAAIKFGAPPAIGTGLPDLDAILGGLRPGEMIVVAARTSVGKSMFGMHLAAFAAGRSWPHLGRPAASLIYSLEMRREALAKRLLSSVSGVDAGRVRDGKLGDVEHERVRQAARQIAKLPITIQTRPGATVDQVVLETRNLHAQGRCDLLVLDYVGLLAPTASTSRDSRHRQIAEATGRLHDLAASLKIPAIVLAQINRAGDASDRPRLAHLKDSGSLEEDADAVLLLSRDGDGGDDPFSAGSDRDRVQGLRIDVAKNRSGRTGWTQAYIDDARQRIVERVEERWEEAIR